MNPGGRTAIRLMAVAALVLALPPALAGQSITGGELVGTVRDSAGAALVDARITVIHGATGRTHTTVTAWTGRFELGPLPPGEYELRAERLGYRPQRIQGVPVRPAQRLDLEVRLATVSPPVDRVDVVPYEGGAWGAATSGSFAFDTDRLPSQRRGLSALARLATYATPDLETEGLPASLSGLVIDGMPFIGVRHPGLASEPLRAMAFPLSAIGHAGLLTNGVDVEWSGFAGGYLSGYTRPGTRELSAHAFGNWSGDALASSGTFDVHATPHSAYQGGLVVSTPLIRDTAHLTAGIEAQRIALPVPGAWETDSVGAAIRAVARDSFDVGLDGYLAPQVLRADIVSGFARVDWQVADRHALSVRGNIGILSSANPAPGALAIRSPDATVEGSDLSVAALLRSTLGERLTQEVRAGFSRSRREYRGGGDGLAGTRIVSDGLAFGTDPGLPGQFTRSAFRASQTLYHRVGAHRLKAGLAATVALYDRAYAYGRSGEFVFADVDAFAERRGLFTGTVGPAPAAEFTVPQYAVFAQDTWSALPGLDITLGLRFELEQLPVDDVVPNTEWRRLTGLSNSGFEGSARKLSPRVGFTWDVRQEHRWLLRGGAGIYFDRFDPGVLGELLTYDRGPAMRRRIGTLSGWPTAPAATVTPDTATLLTLLGPDFLPPRTTRVSFGVSRRLGANTTVHLSASYRRTAFLPRRQDLNLRTAAVSEDQYGRPIFGTLVKQGALLAAAPGSNRRFPAFDRVSALNADGSSDYRGLTLAIERRGPGPLDFFGSYTFSRTEDDWLAARGGAPEDALDPFPRASGGQDWADGRSDLDTPHRVTLGAELEIPVWNGIRVAGLYRYRSGIPFTPGFRTGVDANADGSASNDPAFVDDRVAGVPELLGEWECLRSQVGRFAERNACRTPGIHALDLRIGFGVLRFGRYTAELVVDGLNLIESDVGAPDRALYLVDESRQLDMDATTGTVTVPLVANPDFGKLRVRWNTGRALRLGLRVSY